MWLFKEDCKFTNFIINWTQYFLAICFILDDKFDQPNPESKNTVSWIVFKSDLLYANRIFHL